ncbi:MAG: DsrE family protein [Planctomycetaceae bacterium]|nr:DsrE family protein [Planctomycetaceae bacterium]
MPNAETVLILLTAGKSDNGKNATLAFSCALSALALGMETTVFLTGDGAVWGYLGSARGITVQGFPPLDSLIRQFLEGGGNIQLCSVCHKTCSAGAPDEEPTTPMLPQVTISGFTSMVEIASRGACITF